MIRSIYLLAFALLSGLSIMAAEPTETSSAIKEVTVFLNGAQVSRTFDANLKKGAQTLKITDLSPYLDAKTIQIKGNGDFTILSIRHQMNYIDHKELEGGLKILADSLNHYQRAYKDVDIELNALSHSENFLQMNRAVKGNANMDAATLKSVHRYYYSELLSIAQQRNILNYRRAKINGAIARFRNQLNAINGKLTQNSSEVLLELQAKKSTSGEFMLSYLVNNASWYPSYDIRVQNINNPMQLVYKANVQQNTGEDWDNVKLTFSNANPYQSGDLPVLKPYYLNYSTSGYTANPYEKTKAQNSYNLNNYISSNTTQARGRIQSPTGAGIPYASIKVSGTAVGTIADENGNFAITLPHGKNQLFVSSVGYADKYQAVNPATANSIQLASTQQLAPQIQMVQDLEVRKFSNANTSSSFENHTSYYTDGVSLINAAPPIQYQTGIKSYKKLAFRAPGKNKNVYVSKPITVLPMENQTNIEIILDIPFSIKSNGKQKTISVNEVDVPAYYEYRSVPKLEKAAFLIARVADWGEYNLLEGEANLYFESTYIGKTILDVRYLTDTLNISLGRDKSVLISRQKVKSQTSRVFIGKETIEKRQFEIKVRNNKAQPINLIVYDQVPISQRPKDIEVVLKEKDGAKHNLRTGELKWEIEIDPNKTKELTFKYQVKFPKEQQINLE